MKHLKEQGEAKGISEDMLTPSEQAFLQQGKTCLNRPKELLKLQRLARKAKTQKNNRVARALATCDVLKPSYTNIVL
jgi:hypothetical protein